MTAKNQLIARRLGPVSTHFIDELTRKGKILFTLEDASLVYGKDKHKTGKFLSDLIKQRVIIRIKSGTYSILLTGQENIQLTNWQVIANELAKPCDYFISYYSAMRIHGMTIHPLFDIYITSTARRRSKKIGAISYHFIYAKADNFWGSDVYWINKQDRILVSDIERTLLDALDRPGLCGGIKEIIRGIWIKQNEIDWEKLIRYAEKFHTKAAVKRLGFILETINLGTEYISLLSKIISNAKDYVLLDPDGAHAGNYLKRWFIRSNINTEEIKASV